MDLSVNKGKGEIRKNVPAGTPCGGKRRNGGIDK